MNDGQKSRRRTADEIFSDAVAKLERARLRKATFLNIGERRRSLKAIPPLSGHTQLRVLRLVWTGITDLSPLKDVPQLQVLDLTGTAVWDLTPLAALKRLNFLNISHSSVVDLSPLASLRELRNLDISSTKVFDTTPLSHLPLQSLTLSGSEITDLLWIKNLPELQSLILRSTNITSLDGISYLTKLRHLDLSNTRVSDLYPLRNIKSISDLDLEATPVSDLTPIANLIELQKLDVSRTQVTDIQVVSSLTKLRGLNLNRSKVKDLTPLANHISLAKHARPYFYGLSFGGCPIEDSTLQTISKTENPDRTINTINFLRDHQGLSLLTESDLKEESEKSLPLSSPLLNPVPNIVSAYSFQFSSAGTIRMVSGPVDWPVYPYKDSERDHEDRLEVCRTLAEDLILALSKRRFQAREDYEICLRRYSSRLPHCAGSGSVLLADAEARTLRNIFAADADVLSPGLASQLKTFLEQHIGLRAFYPEISIFYRDVQSGHLNAPLPIDAVEGLVQAVQESTPTVFDPSVREAIEGSVEEELEEVRPEYAEDSVAAPTQPLPPRDPLGNLDPEKTRDFTFAGAANNLWKAFLEGEKIHKAVDGWRKTGEALGPHMMQILNWLRAFKGLDDGGSSGLSI